MAFCFGNLKVVYVFPYTTALTVLIAHAVGSNRYHHVAMASILLSVFERTNSFAPMTKCSTKLSPYINTNCNKTAALVAICVFGSLLATSSSLVACWRPSAGLHLSQSLARAPPNGAAAVAEAARRSAVLLQETSMWGMGAHARVPLKRRVGVPLVTWSNEAIEALRAHYWQLQDPSTCDRVLYIYPWSWGLTSQVRDYSDLAIAAIGARRTIHFVKDGPRPIYCPERAWLECFFKPMSGTKCRRAKDELSRVVPPVSPTGLDSMLTLLLSDAPAVHLAHWPWVGFMVNATSGSRVFPTELWESLQSTGGVRMWDTHGHALNASAVQREDPELYYTLALSALRTMLSSIMFAPKDEIQRLAQARAAELEPSSHNQRRQHNPCVAVHLRWTDKKDDGGVAAKMNFTADHVAIALTRLEKLTSRSYRCVLLLSDDEEAATVALRSLLGDAYEVKPISRMRSLFSSQADYDVYRKKGHFHVRDYFGSRDPAMAHAYVREVFVDIHTAALAAEFLIGPGSSGVSQLLAQYMGARMRVDANAVAMWQEDVLGG